MATIWTASCAHGDARFDSDDDITVFLKKLSDRWLSDRSEQLGSAGGPALDKPQSMVLQSPDEAGRAPYLAGFQAAQAMSLHRSGKVAKTHRGV